jgi:membrane-associated protease RseP (regulator of RpoE activity)
MLALFLGALANLLAFLGVRWALARLWGGSGGLVMLGLQLRWPALSMVRRVSFAVAGPLACYLCAAALLATGFGLDGQAVADESSMRVTVAPGSPAAKAGLRDNDRIVSVDAEPVSDWPGLKQKVSRHPNEEIQVTIERDGHEVVLVPTPDATGKIGVGPPVHQTEMGPGAVVSRALVEPIEVNVFILRTLVSTIAGREKAELSGPAAVMKTTQGLAFAKQLLFAGMLNAYFLWVPTLLALVLFPRAGVGPVARTRTA